MLFWLITGLALATEPLAPVTPVSVYGGLSAQVGSPSVGGGVQGGFVWRTSPKWAVDIGTRETIVTSDPRWLTGIRVIGRYQMGRTWVGGGLAHFHEVNLDDALSSPLLAVIGSLPEIVHRSGLELNAGVSGRIPVLDWKRWGWQSQVSVSLFPDPFGPRAYLSLDGAITLDIGKVKP